ncbi:Wadjet anti-phage system protein JetD domain-containing protein [Amycolatopsis japonica]|uniref:Wadjet anti-phage system protein JetD domain-containing protein n=1 Tax=Amycolatopsis japonica TaxID=208439 RepID=UPI0033203F75
MRTPPDIVGEVRRRLDRTWASDLSGSTASWPHRFPLGTPAKAALESSWQTTYQPLTRAWRDWAHAYPVLLHTAPKRVYSTTQNIPTHLEVSTLEAAATIVGDGWDATLRTARERLLRLTKSFPAMGDFASVIRTVHSYSESDFTLLQTVAHWFQANDATGYTPRQVPIPGVHAKWLNAHQQLIRKLIARDELGLLPPHPARIHFTYLDPTYRASGARHHDSATVGDTYFPPYPPEVVIISENKDTAIHFPPIRRGLAVEGEGFGGKTASAFPWLTGASQLYYWGDIDTYGYEILNGWREDGVDVTSILMDVNTYRTYEPFGTNFDKKGRPLKLATPRSLPLLTAAERKTYNLLVDPASSGHRRIEQERLPLLTAVRAVTSHSDIC